MDVATAYRFGRYELIPSRRQLLVDGRLAPLGSRAIDLLQALLERRDRTVSKGELLDIVWPDVVVEEANLHVQVSALRKVLSAGAIATIPGRGYRFVAALDGPTQAGGTVASPSDASAPGLPVQPSPLIGRDAELAALTGMVSHHPLVTVTGPGGIGKTRLALAVAAASVDRWSDGAVWVEAASVHDAAQLPQAVAQALRLSLGGERDAAQLAQALRSRSMLLLIDNCEHLLGAAVGLVVALRDAAPGVHLLVTSQEALRMPGEQVFRLPPLQLPGVGDVPDERFGALCLFAERARAVDRRFVLDASNGVAVADICHQLDGLPLAIELAAARVKLLGVQGLRDRLGERLRLLTTGARDALPRHQTLRAALEWSHALLSPEEQAVLRRLAVFVGGFTLELAQRVAADEQAGASLDEWAVLDVLGALVDKSMVGVDAGEPVRYRLLETLRVFASERLEATGEKDTVRRRHARAVADLFAAVDEARWGDAGTASASETRRLLQPEFDNARSALEWAVADADWPVAITLAGAAAATFEQLARLRDILPTLDMLRSHLDEAPASAQVNLLWRLGIGGIQGGMGHDELQRVKAEAMARARAAGFRRRLQAVLASLGFTLARRGDIEATESILAELRSLERPDDPAYIRGQRLNVEMMVHEHRNDLEQVVASLGAQRAVLLGAPDEALPLIYCESNLVTYLNALGRHAEAATLGLALLARPELPRSFVLTPCMTAYALASLGKQDEALEVLRRRRSEIAAVPIGVTSGESLAMLCLARGRLGDAVRIDAALERDLGKSGVKPHPFTRIFRARLQAAVEAAQVDPDDLRRWQAEGKALSNAGAVELALR